MNFFRRVLSTITGIVLFCGIAFFGLMLIAALMGGASDSTVIVEKNSVLALNLDEAIPDYAGKFDYGEFNGFFQNSQKYNGLFNIIDAINYAASDEKIKGITLKNNTIVAGMAQTKALRDALIAFKSSGKFVLAYGDVISQKDYYLSSVADTIYLNPVGMLEFKGLATEIMYYKDFQEKYGLKMEVIRHGKYKSAVEGYLRQEMSDENREQISEFLGSIWSEMKLEISDSRSVSEAQLDSIADNLLSRTPKMALASGLIDKIAYEDEFEAALKTALAVDADEDYNSIDIDDYAKLAYDKLQSNAAKDKIAVIYAQGQIMYAEGNERTIGQGVINKALKKAREDDAVKAIVLRVNSPGGSAMASELIWREIENTKKIKPVVVSMGDLAASGGYYIACNADKIYAEPNTITGSIGVFGTLPNIHEMANNIGINAEQVTTNKQGTTFSLFEPLNEGQRAVIKEGIEIVYDTFITRVADGRKMTKAAVDSIAQGRVWTGNDAIKIGLVDEIGGLDEAISAAAVLGEVSDYKLKYLPVYKKDFDQLFNTYGLIQSKEEMMKEELGEETYLIMQKMKKLTQQKGTQLLLPYEIEIK
jgi:protease-4